MRWPPPADWPLASLSRQVACRPHRWHVQETGSGPTVLCLHGAGGSTHSFRDLIPLLAKACHVVAVDFPGQGFTRLGARHRSGLEPVTEDMAALCAREGWQPQVIVGHSAGGAAALRLAERVGVPRVVGLNPALSPFPGLAGVLFPALARVLAMTPFTAQAVARMAVSPARIRALIESTGSTLSPEGIALYQRLVADPGHVDGTLLMMAQWDLAPLLATLPELSCDALFVVGGRDRTVPPEVARRAAARMRSARIETLPEYGHLVHEEAPAEVASRILSFAGLT